MLVTGSSRPYDFIIEPKNGVPVRAKPHGAKFIPNRLSDKAASRLIYRRMGPGVLFAIKSLAIKFIKSFTMSPFKNVGIFWLSIQNNSNSLTKIHKTTTVRCVM